IYQILFRNPFKSNIENKNRFEHVYRRVLKRYLHRAVDEGKSFEHTTVLTEDVLEDVRNRMDQSPNKSLRQLSQQTALSYGTCQKALKKELHLYPCKILVDYNKRVQYCH
ncbi:hypothetical protein ILUMI_03778, partial [Ignelater luminosus]